MYVELLGFVLICGKELYQCTSYIVFPLQFSCFIKHLYNCQMLDFYSLFCFTKHLYNCQMLDFYSLFCFIKHLYYCQMLFIHCFPRYLNRDPSTKDSIEYRRSGHAHLSNHWNHHSHRRYRLHCHRCSSSQTVN